MKRGFIIASPEFKVTNVFHVSVHGYETVCHMQYSFCIFKVKYEVMLSCQLCYCVNLGQKLKQKHGKNIAS